LATFPLIGHCPKLPPCLDNPIFFQREIISFWIDANNADVKGGVTVAGILNPDRRQHILKASVK
jgi:hypothetical protein